MIEITAVHAREVLDSRGNPTVEVEVRCAGQGSAAARRGRHQAVRPTEAGHDEAAGSEYIGSAIVPSGASTGRHEAVELRDGDPARYGGKGVLRAVANVNEVIARELVGMAADDQRVIDERLIALDGTDNKSRLGANAILGVSLACAHAAAAAKGVRLYEHLRELWLEAGRRPAGGGKAQRAPAAGRVPTAPTLPLPMVNMISGGLHAGGNLDFQDFLVMPVGAASYRQALAWAVRIYRALGELLRARGFEGALVGDEGGYGPRLPSNEAAVEMVVAAIRAAGLRPGEDAAVALDLAASHFHGAAGYRLRASGHVARSAAEMVEMLADWSARWPIVSIEDGLAEDDWQGWRALTERFGARVQLVGDDLFVTDRRRLQRGARDGAANAILIKMNQVGTLWETLLAIRAALEYGYRPVVSARSGETEDYTMADLAVATGAGQIKIGSVVRSERLAKYNRLLRIEEWLGGEAAPFASGGLLGLVASAP